MIVYLAMLSFTCLLALISVFMPKRWRIVRHFISFVGYGSMCIFIGLRDHVGADWDNYVGIFSDLANFRSPVIFLAVEPFYAFCNRLVYDAGGDVHLVNLICAFISLAGLYKFTRLVELDANLVLFIAAPYLLFVIGMGYTRQSVAIGLALTGIGYLRHGRDRMFYFFVILAALFHYSAIVLAVLWWLNSVKRTSVVIAAIAMGIPALFVLFSGGRIVRLYLSQNEKIQSHGVGFRLLIIALGLLVVIAQRVRWARETEMRVMIFRGGIVLVLLTMLSLFLSTLADRLCLYLYFIYILGIGSVIRYALKPYKYLSLCFVVSLTYVMFFIWFSLSSFAASAWFPYGMALYSGS
jgi:hypothetical protein